jgi:hypothetical protein
LINQYTLKARTNISVEMCAKNKHIKLFEEVLVKWILMVYAASIIRKRYSKIL